MIFNPTKSGNALAEFEISFSDPLSPPVSTIMKHVSFCPVRRKMKLLKTAHLIPFFFCLNKVVVFFVEFEGTKGAIKLPRTVGNVSVSSSSASDWLQN